MNVECVTYAKGCVPVRVAISLTRPETLALLVVLATLTGETGCDKRFANTQLHKLHTDLEEMARRRGWLDGRKNEGSSPAESV